MKLKNKKTGEIVDLTEGFIKDVGGTKIVLAPAAIDYNVYEYKSLAELSSEWEDATEEPKEYWYIDTYTYETAYLDEGEDDDRDNFNKEIGNYFSSREEAELAVEKLKAFKRLKDKGFRFTHYNTLGLATIQREELIEYKIRASIYDYDDEEAEKIEADLDSLFCTEEDG